MKPSKWAKISWRVETVVFLFFSFFLKYETITA